MSVFEIQQIPHYAWLDDGIESDAEMAFWCERYEYAEASSHFQDSVKVM